MYSQCKASCQLEICSAIHANLLTCPPKAKVACSLILLSCNMSSNVSIIQSSTSRTVLLLLHKLATALQWYHSCPLFSLWAQCVYRSCCGGCWSCYSFMHSMVHLLCSLYMCGMLLEKKECTRLLHTWQASSKCKGTLTCLARGCICPVILLNFVSFSRARTHMRTHVHMYTHACTHTLTHAHTRTHTHTHMRNTSNYACGIQWRHIRQRLLGHFYVWKRWVKQTYHWLDACMCLNCTLYQGCEKWCETTDHMLDINVWSPYVKIEQQEREEFAVTIYNAGTIHCTKQSHVLTLFSYWFLSELCRRWGTSHECSTVERQVSGQSSLCHNRLSYFPRARIYLVQVHLRWLAPRGESLNPSNSSTHMGIALLLIKMHTVLPCFVYQFPYSIHRWQAYCLCYNTILS